jgi:hypothetical protein
MEGGFLLAFGARPVSERGTCGMRLAEFLMDH